MRFNGWLWRAAHVDVLQVACILNFRAINDWWWQHLCSNVHGVEKVDTEHAWRGSRSSGSVDSFEYSGLLVVGTH